ncbi:hypothetical protein LY28_00328 [Ruminiclostridium sufflavum DSM 19573]|uniref:SpoIIAA-like protein n=1 Tax=Ruminiclostridium sufflavum DSM 19573 TaxID=1121337 RepID=A0A318XNK6_9FIRM|nr:hypothetical protein [Ruminiclostridium sufflavum]PYG89735.1 hypothetical protein LY28_00328 [Ruminiclostridium sufflavum DSM 19573]
MLKKSPSGSLCPYYYRGGELHPLHYGSYHDDMDKLSRVIDAEEVFILSTSSPGGRHVWIDLYENNFTDSMIIKLSQHIVNISPKVSKMALVGCSKKVFNKIIKQLYDMDCNLAGQIKLFDDPEISKDWLVGRTCSKGWER